MPCPPETTAARGGSGRGCSRRRRPGPRPAAGAAPPAAAAAVAVAAATPARHWCPLAQPQPLSPPAAHGATTSTATGCASTTAGCAISGCPSPPPPPPQLPLPPPWLCSHWPRMLPGPGSSSARRFFCHRCPGVPPLLLRVMRAPTSILPPSDVDELGIKLSCNGERTFAVQA